MKLIQSPQFGSCRARSFAAFTSISTYRSTERIANSNEEKKEPQSCKAIIYGELNVPSPHRPYSLLPFHLPSGTKCESCVKTLYTADRRWHTLSVLTYPVSSSSLLLRGRSPPALWRILASRQGRFLQFLVSISRWSCPAFIPARENCSHVHRVDCGRTVIPIA